MESTSQELATLEFAYDSQHGLWTRIMGHVAHMTSEGIAVQCSCDRLSFLSPSEAVTRAVVAAWERKHPRQTWRASPYVGAWGYGLEFVMAQCPRGHRYVEALARRAAEAIRAEGWRVTINPCGLGRKGRRRCPAACVSTSRGSGSGGFERFASSTRTSTATACGSACATRRPEGAGQRARLSAT